MRQQRHLEDNMQSEEFVGIDPSALNMGDAYRLLLHCVSPRPIAFVSSVSAEGGRNLAPFSYFMAGGANPPSVAISPTTGRDGVAKDTLRNILETGEYTINIVTYAMRERMNAASAEYAYGIDEYSEAGFTPLPGFRVKTDRVAESPLAMECRLHTVVPHGDGPLSANYVIGEVVYFHIAKSVMPDDQLDPRRVDYISRLGGEWYGRCTPESLFQMARPPRPSR
jgi:flavin reductase (DIM6/NTAB) family NADH-FMN oxidoreductase RutF